MEPNRKKKLSEVLFATSGKSSLRNGNVPISLGLAWRATGSAGIELADSVITKVPMTNVKTLASRGGVSFSLENGCLRVANPAGARMLAWGCLYLDIKGPAIVGSYLFAGNAPGSLTETASNFRTLATVSAAGACPCGPAACDYAWTTAWWQISGRINRAASDPNGSVIATNASNQYYTNMIAVMVIG